MICLVFVTVVSGTKPFRRPLGTSQLEGGGCRVTMSWGAWREDYEPLAMGLNDTNDK
jgi:hypothetical protein